MLDELLTFALVGTAHSNGTPSPMPDPLEQALNSVADPSTEQSLLTRTAFLDICLRSGVKPITSVRPADVAQSETLPRCSEHAADLLAGLLHDREKQLIAEWLSFANSAGQRAPYRLLPNLLDFATREKTFWNSIAEVIGVRGRWLMAKNPVWVFSIDQTLSDQDQWETTTPPQRLLLLRQVREKDPLQAHDLLQKTWKDDPADQRVEFLKLFSIGLSLADEPLLERFLDDRSKTVRLVAADLLGQLPRSAFVKRMIARVSPLLEFERGLLKSAKLVVTLPAELDKSAQRDIVEKTAPPGTGEKQWWLGQMLSFIPPSTWTTAFGLKPTQMISTAAGNDFAETLLKGFNAAAQRHPDIDWIEPLLRHGTGPDSRLNRSLLDALPAQRFLDLALNLLQQKRIGLLACSDLINCQNVALDVQVGRLWIQTVATLVEHGGREAFSIFYQLPGQCIMRIPPILLPEIESLWNIDRDPWNQHRQNIQKMLKAMQTRAQIQKEFS